MTTNPSSDIRDIYVLIGDEMTTCYPNMWFIQNIILQEIPFCLEFEIERMRDSVVIYLTLNKLNIEIVRSLRSRNNKVVLCHLTDILKADYRHNIYLSCDLNLVTHYVPEIFANQEIQNKTLWIPYGFKTGVGPRDPATLRNARHRRYLSSFIGYLANGNTYGNERQLFHKVAIECQQDMVLRETSTFNQGYNACYYSMCLEYSLFCPCPAGHAPETIRLFDVLEMGAIPISLKHDFLGNALCLVDPPFPLIDSWEELPRLLAEFKASFTTDEQAIIDLQSSCINWWGTYKKSISKRIAEELYKLRRQ